MSPRKRVNSSSSCERIVQAGAPSRPIERGYAGPGLLAHVVVSKYCDHQPLYRQSQIYARSGIDLDRSTLAEWVGALSTLTAPLTDALADYVMGASKLHADDTPIPVLAPGTGKTKTGRLWTYVRDDRTAGSTDPPAVLFRYSPDRKGERPRVHLEDFRGILQADGYAGFQGLYDRANEPLLEAACWAHARRKFFEIHAATNSPAALEALERIGALYKIEAEIRGKAPDQRKAHRQMHAMPRLIQLHAWLQATVRPLSRKSPLAGAIGYALSRWGALTRYCEDGRIEIDNNAAERALRTVAVGRRAWLFMDTQLGAWASANLYSIVSTCRANGVEPLAYLTYLYERLPLAVTAADLEALLPWSVKPLLKAAATSNT